MEMTVSQCAAGFNAGKVISIEDYKGAYEDPFTRLLLKYDCLGEDSQASMYGFAKGYICRAMGRTLDRRELLSATLRMGDTGAWEAIEEYTDQLPHGKWTGRASGGTRKSQVSVVRAEVK